MLLDIYDVAVSPRAVFDTPPRPDPTRAPKTMTAQLLTVSIPTEMLL